MALRRPAFETETDVASPWTDCTFSAGSMLEDFHTYGKVHPSHQDLRRRSGRPIQQGGSLADLAHALDDYKAIIRYPQAPDNFRVKWSDFSLAITRGYGAVIQGLYSSLPSYYRRWDKTFWGGHAVFVMHDEATGLPWWMDPLGKDSYAGETISWSSLQAFALSMSFGVGYLFATWLPQAVPVPTTSTKEIELDPHVIPDRVCDILPGGALYKLVNGKLVTVASPWGGPKSTTPFLKGVGTYGAQDKAYPPRTGAPLRALRLDATSGPAEDIYVGLVGADMCINVRDK